MSPICQTFVQNAWRKDLCSNCFKSEEDHGNLRDKTSVEASKKGCYPDGTPLGGRYVSVAGRPGLYPRNYYGSKSWNPLMLDNSHNDSRILKSPGLIKGMDSIIKQENEKNRTLSDLPLTDKDRGAPKPVDDMNRTAIPKDSWILTQIIGDTKLKSVERSERLQGDSSSDLGSDSSHDTSAGSGNISGSDVEVKADSDASSLKSESDSAHGEEYPITGILKTRSLPFPHSRAVKVSISFKEEHEVIGYGGDVDYSDDDYEDDDDEDNSSISSSELSSDERTLKRLTEKNTDFNSENENLADDSGRHGNEFFDGTPKAKPVDDAAKQEVKVKLKRSQPILGAKPQIKSNFSPFTSQSSSLIPQGGANKECIPMQGIKPKFVSRENEMRENPRYEELYETDSKLARVSNFSSKITSIDDIPPMVTSFDISSQDSAGDDATPKVSSVDNSPKVALEDGVSIKTTSTDVFPQTTLTEVSPKTTSTEVSSKTTSTEVSPKTTSTEVSTKTTSTEVSPKTTSTEVSTKTTSTEVSSKTTSTEEVFPKTMSTKVCPKTTSREISPKTTSTEISPKTTSTEVSPKSTSTDTAPKATPTNIASKTTSIDTALKATPTNTASKTTSIDNTPKTTSIHTAPKTTSVDPSKVTSSDNHLASLTPDNCPKSPDADSSNTSPLTPNDPNLTPASDVSTRSLSNCNKPSSSLESRSSKFTKLSPANDGNLLSATNNGTSLSPVNNATSETTTSGVTFTKDLACGREPDKLANPQVVPKKEDVSNYLCHSTTSKEMFSSSSSSNKEKDPDYSVRSSKREIEERCANDSQTESESIASKKEVETSKDGFDQVSSAVVPLNMVTIRRRSSFMESQLGASVFSIDAPEKMLSGRVDTTQSKTSVYDKYRPPSSQTTSVKEGTEKLNEKVVGKVNTAQSQITKSCLTSTLNSENEKRQVDLTTEALQKPTLHNSISTDVNSVVGNLCATKDDQILNEDISKPTEFSVSKLKTKIDNSRNATEVSVTKSNLSPTTNSLSTFGTPVPGSNPPNSSFLHSGMVRPLTELKEINSVIYSTPEFLRGIKSPVNYTTQPSLTASIQKSAIHTPFSSLKGVSLGKPAPTPKPSYLKDKPKVPIKPFKCSTKVFTREISSEKRPNEETLTSDKFPEDNSEDGDFTTLEYPFGGTPKPIESQPAISEEGSPKDTNDIIYDIPVTISDSGYSGSIAVLSAPSPSSSSGYSSSTNVSQSCEPMAKLESELPDSLELPVISNAYVDDDDEIDEALCKAKFELSQRALSEALFPKETEESPEDELRIEGGDGNEDHARSVKPQGFESITTDSDRRLFGASREERRGSESTNSPQLRLPTEVSVPTSYTHLHPPYDTHDVDSYSSFTDDFDDEEEEEEDEDFKTNRMHYINLDNRQKILPLRRTERSSSAAPLFRNSVGPITFSPLSGLETTSDEGTGAFRLQGTEKIPATRSQSVPRSADHVVNPAVFGKSNKPESSSKFGFVKSGFFRPSSPPSAKRKSSSERGRDRTKKSLSVFSLKKFLRFGSGDKSQKATKEPKSPPTQDGYQRETRKLKLQIIHPLDYNTNGVEVISRPEKRSPTYDFTGINDPLIQEALKQHALDMKEKRAGDVTLTPPAADPPDKKREATPPNKTSKVSKKNSFLKKRRKPERKQPGRSDSNVSASRFEAGERPPVGKGQEEGIASLPKNDGGADSTPTPTGAQLTTSVNLGFNSEGRPRPPPPPRKTSLDANAHLDAAFKPPSSFVPRVGAADFAVGSSSSRNEGDTSSLSSSCSSIRPHRPPPPRRTPSTSGSSQGNARAPFTPRKPGRTSSMKDEEREKRKAPNPPLPHHPPNPHQVSTGPKDELSESLQNLCNRLRPSKGPAPLVPGSSQEDLFHAHDYEYITNSSDERGHEKPDSVVTSSAPSPTAKTARQKGRRGSVVTNLSLEDQYGAVVFANLEALSNILDQMCNYSDCSGYESVIEDVMSCSQIQLLSSDPILCGLRLFYRGNVLARDVIVMVTPETKVEVDSLLVPNPVLIFKDEIPSSFFGGRRSSDHSFTSGSVWVLPEMEISSLEEFTHDSQRLLQERPSEWERRISLFLLQVVSALKQLQAKGTEETSLDTILVITKIQGEETPRLLMASPDGGGPVGGSGNAVSLCHCAAAVTQLLLGHHRPLEGALKGPVLSSPLVPSPHAFSALVSCLRDERSGSLTKAKCILEGMLFGPEERRGSIQVEGEGALQKWLDLERANLLHCLVRDQATGHFNRNCLMTKFHLLFLVRTNVKALKEALRVLESPEVTDF